MTDKRALLITGTALMAAFCSKNSLPTPTVRESLARFNSCAYYRNGTITVCVPRCAAIGTAGRQWSYPGYTVDRTPYGVIQHELGHHVDILSGKRRGKYWSEFSAGLRNAVSEEPITSYCPNDAEWFAEMFRLFVTNPDLLRVLRPSTYAGLRAHWKPVFHDTWRELLCGAPARTIAAAEKKIHLAQ